MTTPAPFPATSLSTQYDIASLTKVVATWPLAGQAWGPDGLDQPVREFLPAMAGPAPSGSVTIRHLLTHTSGLRAATRLDQYLGQDAPLHELICREPLDTQPGPHRYINRGSSCSASRSPTHAGRHCTNKPKPCGQAWGWRTPPTGRSPAPAGWPPPSRSWLARPGSGADRTTRTRRSWAASPGTPASSPRRPISPPLPSIS